MHLIQIFLPTYNNCKERFPPDFYLRVRDDLMALYGGLTAYTRAPVQGLWQQGPGGAIRDELVIYEVMAPQVDADWWHRYRTFLESLFEQEAIVIRAHPIQML